MRPHTISLHGVATDCHGTSVNYHPKRVEVVVGTADSSANKRILDRKTENRRGKLVVVIAPLIPA